MGKANYFEDFVFFAEKVAEATTSNYNMMASRNLIFYTNVVFLFHHGGLLPVKNYIALNARMKVKMDERKQRLAPGLVSVRFWYSS